MTIVNENIITHLDKIKITSEIFYLISITESNNFSFLYVYVVLVALAHIMLIP